MYSCSELETVARQYVHRHFLDVVRHEEFLNLTEDRLVTLLQSNSLRVMREEQVRRTGVLSVLLYSTHVYLHFFDCRYSN